MSQFHFDPSAYREVIRREIARYDQLQDAIADATSGVRAASILDLGTRTGGTLSRVQERGRRRPCSADDGGGSH